MDLGTLSATLGAPVGPLRRDLNAASSQLEKYSRNSVNQLGKVKKAFLGVASAIGAYKGIKWVESEIIAVTRLAGRYDVLGITVRVAGENAGYSAKEMEYFEKQLRRTGIAAVESRQTLTKLAAAQVDLYDSSKLARAAQDLAVVGAMNSSQAFDNMTYAIQSAQVRVLRTIGLNVSFEEGYKKSAKAIGKTADELTKYEKIQSRVNTVLDAAEKFQGIYEESMTSAEKQFMSLQRHIDDYRVAFGKAFQPAYLEIVKSKTAMYKELAKAISDPKVQKSLARMAHEVEKVEAKISEFIPTLIDAIPAIERFVSQSVAFIEKHKDELFDFLDGIKDISIAGGKVTIDFLKSVETGLSGILDIVKLFPDEVTGPAGTGLLAFLLTRNLPIAGIVMTLSLLNKVLDKTEEGLKDTTDAERELLAEQQKMLTGMQTGASMDPFIDPESMAYLSAYGDEMYKLFTEMTGEQKEASKELVKAMLVPSLDVSEMLDNTSKAWGAFVTSFSGDAKSYKSDVGEIKKVGNDLKDALDVSTATEENTDEFKRHNKVVEAVNEKYEDLIKSLTFEASLVNESVAVQKAMTLARKANVKVGTEEYKTILKLVDAITKETVELQKLEARKKIFKDMANLRIDDSDLAFKLLNQEYTDYETVLGKSKELTQWYWNEVAKYMEEYRLKHGDVMDGIAIAYKRWADDAGTYGKIAFDHMTRFLLAAEDGFADMFENMFHGKIDDFEEFVDSLLDIWVRMLAEMAAKSAMTNIVIPLGQQMLSAGGSKLLSSLGTLSTSLGLGNAASGFLGAGATGMGSLGGSFALTTSAPPIIASSGIAGTYGAGGTAAAETSAALTGLGKATVILGSAISAFQSYERFSNQDYGGGTYSAVNAGLYAGSLINPALLIPAVLMSIADALGITELFGGGKEPTIRGSLEYGPDYWNANYGKGGELYGAANPDFNILTNPEFAGGSRFNFDDQYRPEIAEFVNEAFDATVGQSVRDISDYLNNLINTGLISPEDIPDDFLNINFEKVLGLKEYPDVFPKTVEKIMLKWVEQIDKEAAILFENLAVKIVTKAVEGLDTSKLVENHPLLTVLEELKAGVESFGGLEEYAAYAEQAFSMFSQMEEAYRTISEAADDLLNPLSAVEQQLRDTKRQFEEWITQLEALGYSVEVITDLQEKQAQVMANIQGAPFLSLFNKLGAINKSRSPALSMNELLSQHAASSLKFYDLDPTQENYYDQALKLLTEQVGLINELNALTSKQVTQSTGIKTSLEEMLMTMTLGSFAATDSFSGYQAKLGSLLGSLGTSTNLEELETATDNLAAFLPSFLDFASASGLDYNQVVSSLSVPIQEAIALADTLRGSSQGVGSQEILSTSTQLTNVLSGLGTATDSLDESAQDLLDAIKGLNDSVQKLFLAGSVDLSLFDWPAINAAFEAMNDLDSISSISFEDFMSGINLEDFLLPDVDLGDVDLEGLENFDWKGLFDGFTTAVATIDGLTWTDYISVLTWDSFIGTIDWATFVGSLSWNNFISSFGWDQFIGSMYWTDFITAIGWDQFIGTPDWDQFISAVDLNEFFTGEQDWASFFGATSSLDWNTILGGTDIDWDSIITSPVWEYLIDYVDPAMVSGLTEALAVLAADVGGIVIPPSGGNIIDPTNGMVIGSPEWNAWLMSTIEIPFLPYMGEGGYGYDEGGYTGAKGGTVHPHEWVVPTNPVVNKKFLDSVGANPEAIGEVVAAHLGNSQGGDINLTLPIIWDGYQIGVLFADQINKNPDIINTISRNMPKG